MVHDPYDIKVRHLHSEQMHGEVASLHRQEPCMVRGVSASFVAQSDMEEVPEGIKSIWQEYACSESGDSTCSTTDTGTMRSPAQSLDQLLFPGTGSFKASQSQSSHELTMEELFNRFGAPPGLDLGSFDAVRVSSFHDDDAYLNTSTCCSYPEFTQHCWSHGVEQLPQAPLQCPPPLLPPMLPPPPAFAPSVLLDVEVWEPSVFTMPPYFEPGMPPYFESGAIDPFFGGTLPTFSFGHAF